MRISKRLKVIASFIDDDSKVIDVGCDHALLDIFLVLHRKNVRVIASDINPRPLLRAEQNIRFYGVEDAIELRVGDGIVDLDVDIDTIVMSGLGGETIIAILKRDLDKLSDVKKIVVSPHNSLPEVRNFMMEIGYRITREKLLRDQKKFYTIIEFVPGKMTCSDDELFFGPLLLKNRNALFYDYYRQMLEQDLAILDKIPLTNDVKRTNLLNEIERLDKILKV